MDQPKNPWGTRRPTEVAQVRWPRPTSGSCDASAVIELRLLPDLARRRRELKLPPHPAIVEIAKALARVLAREDDEKQLDLARRRVLTDENK